jgi:hypothetical protein
MARARVDAALQPFLLVTAIESDYSGKRTGSAPFTKSVARFGAQAPEGQGRRLLELTDRLSLAGSELVRSAAVVHGRSSNRHRDAALSAAKQLRTGMHMNAWFVPPIVVPLGLALALVTYGGFVHFY